MKQITSLIILLLAFNFGYGQIVAWSMNAPNTTGNEATLDARTLDVNLNMSTLRRGAGIDPDALARTFSSDDYTNNGTQTDAINNNDYFEFNISPVPTYQVSLSTLDANFRRSNTGPNTFLWRYSLDGVNFTDIGTPFTYTDVGDGAFNTQAQIDLASIPALQNVVSGTIITFRLYGWGSTNAGGSFAFGRLNGDELSIGGSVTLAPCPGGTVTWNGIAWSNITGPDLTTQAIISGNYDTNINTSFSACTLTVDNNATLNIDNNDFVQVENELIISAGSTITVQPSGAFVQNNDASTNNISGNITVSKTTSPLNNWFEYTYWSSPVSGETIGNGLFESQITRRFVYNGENYLDATQETNNDNATLPGQDDIDDNGDDWQWVDASVIMQPGVGYAATHRESLFVGPPFSSPPYQFDYTFEGPFNNGIINVPIYRNDSELNDSNWNLIGNPYPSAIDADLFLAANSNINASVTTATGSTIDGAIFIWSQNTAPSETANGNEGLNFADGDYSIINGMGEVPGGDGDTPFIAASGIRVIPSGQAFFVSMSNGATASLVSGDVWTADVVFNNSMRVFGADDNTKFFKNTSSKNSSNTINKLSVRLTSNNGVFNQILVGYTDKATDAYDGMYFDAIKNLSSNTSSALYSLIENSDKKFAIQGKASNSLDNDEIIKLGFKTSIDVATIYILSVAQFQGDFLSNNNVYLKDNLTSTIHNLSDSDYNFTSEVGEFNDRFEIAFSAAALSNEDFESHENTIKIVQLDDSNIKFTSEASTFKSIEIFDLLGRSLYQLKGESNSESYNLSPLKDSVYIANIELANGTAISKKFIKK